MDLRKNRDYWQPGRPYLDRVTYRFITDPTVKVVDLISGAVQTVDYVDSSRVKRVTADTAAPNGIRSSNLEGRHAT